MAITTIENQFKKYNEHIKITAIFRLGCISSYVQWLGKPGKTGFTSQ